ncbi:hypothetical protein, variant 3 [Verruconis gallopava]|uniref:Uncharacterized protein n=1 Tax=Verruconis gallopava TaxID=253628 RepID=A0A0D1Z3R6_9PEZI|nr:hypothetical protein, variant 1 [Verruconis gallopava]XP_016217487.1 hypothetical protein, variant 2 [Verruconis gallopava]XP_016217488.1 hypothetical protein, variant 3 [Verruconis gallopava]KIW07617.1 hypothetical protein, variant 1 [Verruconis gallopava]KIW07618.1 hypothetical protein, variant 2 [Verruconis gallopava]KIW07619.1 hypothetical protein, variant 3 [Verruconis gallopava]
MKPPKAMGCIVNQLLIADHLQTKVLGVEVCFRDPAVAQWGLENFLLPIGGDIIEVVAPFKEGTTAGRLLEKRGEGGYMIIMQNLNAQKRRQYIESKKLSKVIFEHVHDDVTCIQYHPKGIKGGMMPELDSHAATEANPNPLKDRFSPWHACGKDYEHYSRLMRKYGDLHLSSALLRLAPGDWDTEGASRQWESIFGVGMSRDLVAFTNARMGFVRGQEGKPEGLDSITISVNDGARLDGILQRASDLGLCGDGFVNMCNVKWYFRYAGGGRAPSRL